MASASISFRCSTEFLAFSLAATEATEATEATDANEGFLFLLLLFIDLAATALKLLPWSQENENRLESFSQDVSSGGPDEL